MKKLKQHCLKQQMVFRIGFRKNTRIWWIVKFDIKSKVFKIEVSDKFGRLHVQILGGADINIDGFLFNMKLHLLIPIQRN